jgi:hypothetical protein
LCPRLTGHENKKETYILSDRNQSISFFMGSFTSGQVLTVLQDSDPDNRRGLFGDMLKMAECLYAQEVTCYPCQPTAVFRFNRIIALKMHAGHITVPFGEKLSHFQQVK